LKIEIIKRFAYAKIGTTNTHVMGIFEFRMIISLC